MGKSRSRRSTRKRDLSIEAQYTKVVRANALIVLWLKSLGIRLPKLEELERMFPLIPGLYGARHETHNGSAEDRPVGR